MAASVRSVKRSRVSYDDVDPVSSDAMVSASLGMFAASEHQGLYADSCQLAEIILWGKGERGLGPSGLRYVAATWTVPKKAAEEDQSKVLEENYAYQQIFRSGQPVVELFETSDGKLIDAKQQLTLNKMTLKFESANLTLSTKEFHSRIQFDTDETTIDLTSTNQKKNSSRDIGVVALLPPIALVHLGETYIFDAPCVWTGPFNTNIELHSGLRCSSLGDQSPVLHVPDSNSIDARNGRWSLMAFEKKKWLETFKPKTEEHEATFYTLAKCHMTNSFKVQILEQKSGGGRAFVNSWTDAERRGEPTSLQILWGAVPADFWDRTLNVSTPWSAVNLGSLNADEGVSGSLMEAGASMTEDMGLSLGQTEDSLPVHDDAVDDDESPFELVALNSLRFMRDTSVAYPSTIVSFDGGSHGWALEMYDSVATNALELAYFLLSSHFQL